MRLHLRSASLLAAISLFFVVAACGSKKDEFAGDESLLRYVPADTPYMFASGEPMPDDFLDALEPHLEELFAAYRKLFSETYRASLEDPESEITAEEAERLNAVAGKLLSMLSVKSFERAGIDRDSQVVLYGNGLLPVMRVEVGDEAAFEQMVAEIEESAGEKVDAASLGDFDYRYVADAEGRIILGVHDGNAVVAFVPSILDEAETRDLLGLELPAKSILSTSVIADITKEYGFTNHYVGFIDTVQLASTFLNEPTGLNATLIEHMEFDPAEISPICKEEIMEVAGVMPRIVAGYDTISKEEVNGSVIVELRDDISAGLTNVSALVPGLGKDQGGLFSFGLSANLLSWREFYEARLDALEADPFRCEYFADLQAGVEKGRAWLQQPVPPLVYGVRGFNAVVESVEGFDIANKQPPESVDASVVLAVDDAQSLFAMGAMFSPQLANMGLKPDGEPVELQVPQVNAVAKEAYAAMLEDALAVSVGVESESRVKAALVAETDEPPPVFAMTMDAGKYYELVSAGMLIEPDEPEAETMSPEAREAVSEIMEIMGDIYDRMALEMQFTDKGAVIRSRVTLDDL